MGLKTYFTGKSGKMFWLNIILMIIVLAGVPAGLFYALGLYTHKGEKIEVPSVIGKNSYEAEKLLESSQLVAVVSDSSYSAQAAPGTILEQSPKAGSEVKSGRIIYLTINLNGAPMVKMPDMNGNCSLREAVAQLKALGFKLAPFKYIEGEPKDLVIEVRQGMRRLTAGEMVSRDRALTLYVGEGFAEDTILIDSSYIEQTETPADFDIDL